VRSKLVTLVALAAVAPWLSACGAGDPASSPTSSGSSSSTASGTSIDITIKDGRATPNGDRVEVEVGAPVALHIDADTAGEIHVHSTPEQEIEFTKGRSTKTLTITKPGIVDVEDHALDQVIVQLEAH
jgi:hypothetical protein